MNKTFRVNQKTINDVIARLKAVNLISDEANSIVNQNKRSEVSYRDFDFLEFLGVSKFKDEIVDEALIFLLANVENVENIEINWEIFENYRLKVKKEFEGSWSTITPAMEKLLFSITALKKPKVIVEIGSFWGNSLAWFCGPAHAECNFFKAKYIYGIEIDKIAHLKSISNFKKLKYTNSLNLVCQNGYEFLENLNEKIDILYLEAKPENEENIYINFLKCALPKLNNNAWVIAHDTTRFLLQPKLTEYLNFVRNNKFFESSFSFDIDNYGLELSVLK